MNPDELGRLREIAERAAEIGGQIVARRFGGPVADREEKRAGDYVTAVDRESEDAIRAFLDRETPDIPILAEEKGGERGDVFWAVDPLDATMNFLLGMPVVAVSIGLVAHGRPAVGAVRAPLLDLAFSGTRGQGARCNGRRLSVSDRPVGQAVVAVAFPFRRKSLFPRYLAAFQRVFMEAEDVRRAGAAALDLAWTAAGVFDGFFELNLSVWDVAAGALLVEEAGGAVTDWEGGQNYLAGEILAGSPATHEVLLRAAKGSAGASNQADRPRRNPDRY